MTAQSSSETSPATDDTSATEGSDQTHYHHQYRHGRMPFFMKVVWLAFLAFAAWYVSEYLLTALQDEIG